MDEGGNGSCGIPFIRPVSFPFTRIIVCCLGDRTAQNVSMVAPSYFLIFNNLDINEPHSEIWNKKFWKELFRVTLRLGLCHSSGGKSPASHLGAPGSRKKSVHIGFVVDQVALGKIFS